MIIQFDSLDFYGGFIGSLATIVPLGRCEVMSFLGLVMHFDSLEFYVGFI